MDDDQPSARRTWFMTPYEEGSGTHAALHHLYRGYGGLLALRREVLCSSTKRPCTSQGFGE